MNRTAGFSLVLSIIILIKSVNTIPFEQKFSHVWKSPVLGGVVLNMQKAIAAPGVGWFFPMKSGILPQAPGKKIACAIFEIECVIFEIECAIFEIVLRHFCIGRPCSVVQVGVDHSSSL